MQVEKEDAKENAEEMPEYDIAPEEQAFYDKISLEKQNQIRLKSEGLVESYADNTVRGTWHAKQFAANWNFAHGYRVVSSAYDKEKDILYTVSFAGHIWRIDYDTTSLANTEWTVMNHSHVFMTESRSEWFDILNIENETGDFSSRMVRSYSDRIEYSDDEGRNWSSSKGVTFQVTGATGCIANSDNGDRAVVLAQVANANKVAISYDGINYTTTDLSINKTDYATTLFKAHNSENVYVAARNKTTNKTTLYRMLPSSSTFEELHTAETQIDYITRITGTYVDDVYHFYYMCGNAIYYSDDEGASWTKVEAVDFGSTDGDCTIRTVHPTQPSTLFRGYLDTYMSTDKGASFTGWGWKLGWDCHHMRMHQRKDGSYMHFVGNDFGVYISTTPEDKTTYFQLNHLCPIQMAYDMDVSNNFSTAFTALQDRGARSFDNSDKPYTGEIRSTDGLRVTLANNEKSVWSWMYFGTVYYQSNFGYKDSDKSDVNFAGSWVGGSMVASPDPEEDAVIIAVEGEDKLRKLKYNEETGGISSSVLPFDFKALTGQSVSAFGYCPLNKEICYAMVKNGAFLYSFDGGVTYTQCTSSTLAPGNDQGYNYARNQQVIKGSKLDETKVYVAGVSNAFYISKDNGKTFTNYNNGLDVYRIRDFDVSEDEKFIFAACGTAGAWVYAVDKNMWYKMDGADVPYVDFTAVNYTPAKGMVQFGTYGYGVLDFKFERADTSLIAPQGVVGEAISSSRIKLTWEAQTNDIDGYIVRRSTDFIRYEDVATLDAQTVSFADSMLFQETEYCYRVVSYKGENTSLPCELQLIKTTELTELDKSEWSLINVSSATTGSEGDLAFDNSLSTKWSSNTSETYPHEISIDLGSVQEIEAFNYIGVRGGYAKTYEFYISNDTTNWGEPVVEGAWESTNTTSKTVYFEKNKGQYVRFVALDGFDETDKVSMTEIQLWPDFDKRLETPTNLETYVLTSTAIKVSWENVSTNIDGFIIERMGLNGLEEVGRVTSTKSYYTDNTLEPYTTYEYYISAYRGNEVSESATIQGTTSSTGLVDGSTWSDVYCDSEQFMKGAKYAYDGDQSTWWSSKINPSITALPHEIQIDMGKVQSLVAFSYIPCGESEDGMIGDFEFYISNDVEDWGTPVASGTFTEVGRQNVGFTATSGRYIRLVATSEINGNQMTNIAELLVWNQYDGTPSAIKEQEQSELKVYPVPFESNITIELEDTLKYHTAVLLSNDGRMLLSQKVNDNTIEMDIPSNFASGVYFIKLVGDDTQIVRRVLKK